MTHVVIFNFKELSSSTDELDLIKRSAIYSQIDGFGIFLRQRNMLITVKEVLHLRCVNLKISKRKTKCQDVGNRLKEKNGRHV